MSINFNSSTGGVVGQTGQFSTQLQVLQNRHAKDELWLGAPSTLYGYCVTQGLNTDKVLSGLEQDMGYKSNSLSWGKSVASNYDTNDILFQDANGNFVEMNLSKNTYQIKSEKNIVEEAGLKTSDYDKLVFDQGGFSFFKFVRTGRGDGVRDFTGFFRQQMENLRWGLTSVILSEYDSAEDFYNI